MTTEDAADRLRVLCFDLSDVEPELEAGATPVNPHHLIAEGFLGELLAIFRRSEGDSRVGVKVVDVGSIHESVHGGVDGWRSATFTVKGVVERRNHFVFALNARVDVRHRAQTVEAQHGEARFRKCAKVSAGTLDPHELNRLARDRVGLGALG